MASDRARPVGKGLCKCCEDYRDVPLYLASTAFGLALYCSPCCRSLGFRAGRTSEGNIIPRSSFTGTVPQHRR